MMMLIMPKPINSDRAIVASILDDCSIANRIPDVAWKVNKGNSDGVDKTKASNTPPTMIPATNVANMAYL